VQLLQALPEEDVPQDEPLERQARHV
jgi:hypothetical protein